MPARFCTNTQRPSLPTQSAHTNGSWRRAQDLVNINLDFNRNKIIKLELLITIATFAIACYACVAGVLGENLVLPEAITQVGAIRPLHACEAAACSKTCCLTTPLAISGRCGKMPFACKSHASVSHATSPCVPPHAGCWGLPGCQRERVAQLRGHIPWHCVGNQGAPYALNQCSQRQSPVHTPFYRHALRAGSFPCLHLHGQLLVPLLLPCVLVGRSLQTM
jgi:hypothetical protein